MLHKSKFFDSIVSMMKKTLPLIFALFLTACSSMSIAPAAQYDYSFDIGKSKEELLPKLRERCGIIDKVTSTTMVIGDGLPKEKRENLGTYLHEEYRFTNSSCSPNVFVFRDGKFSSYFFSRMK